MEIRLREVEKVVGTRAFGEQFRNQLLGVLQDHDQVVLDFEGVTVSNSFADEVLGKLVLELGLDECKRRIEIRNLNTLSRLIMRNAVAQRAAQAMAVTG